MKTKWMYLLSSMLIMVVATILVAPSYAYAKGEGEYFAYLALIVVVIVVLFLLFRELFCWYWKINERVSLLKEIRDTLQSSQRASGYVTSSDATLKNFKASTQELSSAELYDLKKTAGEDATTIPYTTETEWICVCGTHNHLERSKKIQNCTNCGRSRNFVLTQYGKK
jgi:uncharacterized membrane protein YcjF (UPF0283 family)